mgnify:CR=1 FL=1
MRKFADIPAACEGKNCVIEQDLGVRVDAFGHKTDEETGETSITDYDNTYYSVTFSVNDDLSIGYNHVESDQSGGTLDAEATSYQAAYTMGYRHEFQKTCADPCYHGRSYQTIFSCNDLVCL